MEVDREDVVSAAAAADETYSWSDITPDELSSMILQSTPPLTDGNHNQRV